MFSVLEAVSPRQVNFHALQAATFVKERMWDADSGRLRRSFRLNASDAGGYADDYAHLVEGLLDLYQVIPDVEKLGFVLICINANQAGSSEGENPRAGFCHASVSNIVRPVTMKHESMCFAWALSVICWSRGGDRRMAIPNGWSGRMSCRTPWTPCFGTKLAVRAYCLRCSTSPSDMPSLCSPQIC